LKKAVEGFKVGTEVIQLSEADIRWCDACGFCKDIMKCVVEDDVELYLRR
jgi:multimeric flavodoxin WrbA